MRTLITGLNAAGQSCVVSDRDVATCEVPGMPGILNAVLYRTTECPPPARPPALAENVDVQLPAGLLRLMIVDHVTTGTGDELSASRMHNTDALDIVYVVEGHAKLMLEDGTYTVCAGECVITPGVDHGWEPGPVGARFLVFSLGTEPLVKE